MPDKYTRVENLPEHFRVLVRRCYYFYMIQTFEHGPIRELRLNRPPVNALSPELIGALLQAIKAAPQDGKRALVLSGSPGCSRQDSTCRSSSSWTGPQSMPFGRHAERLAVPGLLITPAEAAACGLVDELATVDQVVGRSVKWCGGLLVVPRTAMEITRRRARTDLIAEFAGETAQELAEATRWWWSEETQKALRRMVEQLAMKKKSAGD